MHIVNIMFTNTLRSKLTISLFSEESTDVDVGTKITCAAGRNIVVFTNLQTLGKFRDRDFRIEEMLNVAAEKLPGLFVVQSVEEMLLQNQRRLLVLEVVRLLASGPERALAFHEVPAHVQLCAKVFRASLLSVEVPTKLDGDDRFNDERSTFVGDEEEARVKLQKRTHAVPLGPFLQQTDDPLYLLNLQNVFQFQNARIEHNCSVHTFREVYFQFVI